MKKITLIVSLILMSASLSFANQDKGVCKSLAEKTAMSLFSAEASVSDLNKATTEIKLQKKVNSYTSQWQISFFGDEETGEWGVIYTIDVINYGDSKNEACFLKSVTVVRAG